jgi:hypothetical protein
MYLELGLLYVGVVLVLNGIWLLGYTRFREIWVMKIFRAWKHLTFHIHAAHRLIHSSTWKGHTRQFSSSWTLTSNDYIFLCSS